MLKEGQRIEAGLNASSAIEAVGYHAPNTPRTEYRRNMVRNGYWGSLNGPWNSWEGYFGSWYQRELKLTHTTTVPWHPQHELSDYPYNKHHPITHLIQQREVDIPGDLVKDKQLILHFGSVNYLSRVSLNGRIIANHSGKYGFSVPVEPSDLKRDDKNLLTVFSFNDPRENDHGHDKESEKVYPFECMNTWETGIRKPVWWEAVAPEHIKYARFRPDLQSGRVTYDIATRGRTYGMPMQFRILYKGQEVLCDGAEVDGRGHARGVLKLGEVEPWSPDTPNLYQIESYLGNTDAVSSTTGFSQFERVGEKYYLNGEEFYIRGILFHVMNPRSAEVWREQVRYFKHRLGLNTISMHMGEDPYLRRVLREEGMLGIQSGGNWGLDHLDPAKWRGEVGRWGRFVNELDKEPETKVFLPLVETPFLDCGEVDPKLFEYMYNGTHAVTDNATVIVADGWSKLRDEDGTIHFSDGNWTHIYAIDTPEEMGQKVDENLDLMQGEKTASVISEHPGVGVDPEAAEKWIPIKDRGPDYKEEVALENFCYHPVKTPEEGVDFVGGVCKAIDEKNRCAGRIMTMAQHHGPEITGVLGHYGEEIYNADDLREALSDHRPKPPESALSGNGKNPDQTT